MKRITQKFIKSHIVTFFVIGDVFIVLVFLMFYLVNVGNSISIVAVVDELYKTPSLLIALLHPLFFWVFLKYELKVFIDYQDRIEAELDMQKRKSEEVYLFVEALRLAKEVAPFSAQFQKDKLVRSITNLREDLEKARKEEDLRKKEEQQRHWTNEGLAKFGAILRSHADDLETLASKVTSELTQYLNCQQAGFFLIKEEEGEKFIDMIALFAFDRKKFPDKRFMWGEGLIGASILEKKTIFLKDTSDNFVDITSGLGSGNPRSVLIVPIKDSEDEVHGALELASFKIFEEYEVNFVEQVAESIGMTIASLKINLRTQELLKESQEQAERLAQQEARMRQQIQDREEQRAIMTKRMDELEEQMKAFQDFSSIVKLDLDRRIVYANDRIAEVLEYPSSRSLKGKEITELLANIDKINFDAYWETLIDEKKAMTVDLKFITRSKVVKWFSCILYPILDDQNTIETVYLSAFETSAFENQIKEYELFEEALDKISIIIELDEEGQILKINQKFIDITGLDNDILGQKFEEYLSPQHKETFHRKFIEALKGENIFTLLNIFDAENNEIILEVSMISVTDPTQLTTKLIIVGTDHTEKIENIARVQELEKELEKLKKQLAETEEVIEHRVQAVEQKYKSEITTLKNKNFILDKIFELYEKALVVLDNEIVVFFNNKAEELFNYKKDLAIGKKARFVFSADVYNDEPDFIINYLDKDIKDQKLFVADRNQNKIWVNVDIVHIELEQRKLTVIIFEKTE